MKNKYNNLIETGKTYGPFTAKLKMASPKDKGSEKYLCSCKCSRELMLSSYQLATGDGAVCPSCGAKIDSPICEKPKRYAAPTNEALDLELRKERAATLVATGIDPCGTYDWCAFCNKSDSTPCAKAKRRYQKANAKTKAKAKTAPKSKAKPKAKSQSKPKTKSTPVYKVGDIVGKLEILAITPRGYSCRCVDCKNERNYSASQLAAGKCISAFHDRDMEFIGKRFGSLVVEKRVYRWQKSSPRAKNWGTSFLCVCDCGHKAIKTTQDLRSPNLHTKTCGWAKCIAKLLGADKCDAQAFAASIKHKLDDAAAKQALDGRPYYALEMAKMIGYFNGSNWFINVPGLSHNPTGIAGVHPHPSGSYKAEITWREAKISLGYFSTLPEAALIRKEAEVYLRHATELELAKIYGGPQMSLDEKLALIGLDVNTRAIDVIRGATV